MYLQRRDLEDAALLVIDMQRGFCSETGGLASAGASVVNQRAILPRVADLVSTCRQKIGLPILWSQQVHFRADATRRKHRIPTHMDKRNLDVCLAGSDDVKFAEELEDSVQRTTDFVFEKHRASCFFDTTLDTKLRMLEVSILLISGCNSNYCVDATVRDAYARDYDLLLIKDCVAGSFDDLHAAFLKNFDLYFGESLSLEEFHRFVEEPSEARI